MSIIIGIMWFVFVMTIGRHLGNPDFASSAPKYGASPDTSPTYYIFLFGWYVAACVILAGIPGLILGIGLHRLRPWAKPLGIAVSVIDVLLLNPIHLVLGIYGITILVQSQAAKVFASGD